MEDLRYPDDPTSPINNSDDSANLAGSTARKKSLLKGRRGFNREGIVACSESVARSESSARAESSAREGLVARSESAARVESAGREESAALMANPMMSRRSFFSIAAAVGALTFMGSVLSPRGSLLTAWADEEHKIHFTLYILGRDELPIMCFDLANGEENREPVEGMEITIRSHNNSESVQATTSADGLATAHIKALSQQADDDKASTYSFFGSVEASKDGYREFNNPEIYIATGVPASPEGDHSNTLEIPTHKLGDDNEIYLRTAALDSTDVQYCDAECGVGSDNTVGHSFQVEVVAPMEKYVDIKVVMLAPNGDETVWGQDSIYGSNGEDNPYKATYKGAWLADAVPGSMLKVKFGIQGEKTYVMTSQVSFVETKAGLPDAYGDASVNPGTDSDETPAVCPLPSWIIATSDTLSCAFPATPLKLFSDNKGNFGISATLLQLTFLKNRNGEDKLEDGDKVKHFFGGLWGEKAWAGFANEVTSGLNNLNDCLDDANRNNSAYGRTNFTSKIDGSFQVQLLGYFNWKQNDDKTKHYWTGDLALAFDLGITCSWTKQFVAMVPFYCVIDLAANLTTKLALGMKFDDGFKNIEWGHTLGKSHLAVIVVIHIELGVAFAAGVAGIAGLGLRVSGYLHLEYTFDKVEGKPNPHITGKIAAKGEAFVQLFFLKKTWALFDTPVATFVDTWDASKASALASSMSQKSLAAGYYSARAWDDATVVTADELSYAADYTAVATPLDAKTAQAAGEGTSASGYIMQISPKKKRISNAMRAMEAETEPNFLDPYKSSGAIEYNPLRGLKPTFQNLIYEESYSNSRVKVTHGYSGYVNQEVREEPVVRARLVSMDVTDPEGNTHAVTRVALSTWNYSSRSFDEEQVVEFSVEGLDSYDRCDVDFDFDVAPVEFTFVMPSIVKNDVAFIAITSVVRSDDKSVEDYQNEQFVTVIKWRVDKDSAWNQQYAEVHTMYGKLAENFATSNPRVLMQCRLCNDAVFFNETPALPFVYYYCTDIVTGATTLHVSAFEFSDMDVYIDDIRLTLNLPSGLTDSDLQHGSYDVYTTDRKKSVSGQGGIYSTNVVLGWTGRCSSLVAPATMADDGQGAPYSFVRSFQIGRDGDGVASQSFFENSSIDLPYVSSLTKRTIEDGQVVPFLYHDDSSQAEQKPYKMVKVDVDTLALSIADADGATKTNRYFASHDGKWLYTVRVVEHEIPGLSDEAHETVNAGGKVYSEVYTNDDSYGDLGDVLMSGGTLKSYQLLEARLFEGLESYYEFYPIAQLDFCPDNIDIVEHKDGRRDFIMTNIAAVESKAPLTRYALDEEYEVETVYHVANVYQVAVPHALGLHVKSLRATSPFATVGEYAYLTVELANTGNWFITGFDVEFFGPDDQSIGTTTFANLEMRVMDTKDNYKRALDDDGNVCYEGDGTPVAEKVASRFDELGMLAPGTTRKYFIEFKVPEGLEGENDFSLIIKNPRCETSDVRAEYITTDDYQVESELAFVDPNVHGIPGSEASETQHSWTFLSKAAPYAIDGEDPQPEPAEEFAITAQPESVTAKTGETVTLSVTATAAQAYQWQHSRNGKTWHNTKWEGYDTNTLSFKMLEALDGRQWHCIVTSAIDGTTTATSDAATTTLPTPSGQLLTQPVDCYMTLGSLVTMSVTVSGDVESFRWQHSKDGTSWSNTSWASSDSPDFSFAMLQALDKRQWRCVITFTDGTSVASIGAVTYLDEPTSVSYKAGDSVTLFANELDDATGFQWQHSKDGKTWHTTQWKGYDTDMLTFNMLTALDGRQWRCRYELPNGIVGYSKVVETNLED